MYDRAPNLTNSASRHSTKSWAIGLFSRLSNPEQKALEKYLDDHEETVPYKFIELSEDLEYAPLVISKTVGEKDCEIFGITRKLNLY